LQVQHGGEFNKARFVGAELLAAFIQSENGFVFGVRWNQAKGNQAMMLNVPFLLALMVLDKRADFSGAKVDARDTRGGFMTGKSGVH
jgi:hypothetical protein